METKHRATQTKMWIPLNHVGMPAERTLVRTAVTQKGKGLCELQQDLGNDLPVVSFSRE